MGNQSEVSGAAAGTGVPEDFAVVIDAGLRIMACSAGAQALLGHTSDEIVGRPAADFLAADLPHSAGRRLSAAEPWTSDVVLRHRHGDRVLVRLSGTPLPAGETGPLWLVTGAATTYASGPGEADAAVLWDRALAQLPLSVAVYDDQARFVACNQIMSQAMGMTSDEMKGLTLTEIQASHREMDHLQRRVLRTGEALYREQRPGRAPGEVQDHAWSVYLTPLKEPGGSVQGLSALVIDTTEQYWARRRLEVLNEASARIGSTLDVTRTAEELADVAVSGFADYVVVDLLESVVRGDEPEAVSPTGPVVLSRCAHASVLPGCPEAAVAVGETTTRPAHSPAALALRTGRGTRHRISDPVLREYLTESPARGEAVRRFGMHSVLLVPLRARGVTLGLVHLVRHRTPEAFGDDDLLLAEEMAARAAVSIDNARRYSQERRTALALQRSLLPERLPAPAAVDLAYRYLPAGSASGVGGDWFDVIPLSGGRVALVVGDVVGHGIHASATMGRLRTAVRTLADVDLAPDELLTQLDDLVVRLDREEGPEARGLPSGASGEVGATCLYAVYDPVSCTCRMARAGHPPPALVAPDGTVRFLDLPAGPPLGVGGLPFEAVEVELDEGSVLALYTDGLIEAADRDIDRGLGLLRDALAHPPSGLEDLCDQVVRKVIPAAPADDIVLLLARTSALDADRVHTWRLPTDPAQVAGARREASDQLTAWGLDELGFATELIVSELVTNAIRYGSAPIELRLLRGDTLICEVSDGSSTAPHLRRARTFDEGGRGLLLVAQLAERWGSRQTATGKTIWAELPLPD
ncbi:ATP-binding SpoIIE family protein phosphatase [Streptomyces griseorubiginosus]|uniref:PAS sensor protein n=1 Tax=Streptomyces griseorubiginosus TaxID=67304 RepID=A0A101RSM5_9ACTN|nr:SpoIIE family protein phosphatase [Streptomyces griseorubiginosus]AYC43853.1 Phosphoserine phosphatase RsbU [Streptomyces griseorubiginosus]KUN60996.1 PAS sensor protein [Streptomyces griseorubiginosus]